MKGYKMFNPGLICNGKQYAENTTFEEKGANSCCNAGVMHFCVEPFDCLNYYPLVDGNGKFSDFAEVEALGEVLKSGDKRATKKLHIGAKLSFKDFIKAGIDVLIETTSPKKIKRELKNANGDSAKIGSSGDSAKIGSSGDSAQIGSSGYSAQIGSSGDSAQIGSSGNYAQIGSSGNYAKIGSSGDSAQINCTGNDSVICCAGHNSTVKAKIGCWITLSEWAWSDEKKRYIPKGVKTEYVDGERIKADTWYKLENGEFVEVKNA